MKTLEELCTEFLKDKNEELLDNADMILRISAIAFGEVFEGDIEEIKINTDDKHPITADIIFYTMENIEFADGRVERGRESNMIPMFLYFAATYEGYSDVNVLISHLDEMRDNTEHGQQSNEYNYNPMRETFIRVLKALNKNLTEEGRLWLEFNE
jgi:hypothetical protein